MEDPNPWRKREASLGRMSSPKDWCKVAMDSLRVELETLVVESFARREDTTTTEKGARSSGTKDPAPLGCLEATSDGVRATSEIFLFDPPFPSL